MFTGGGGDVDGSKEVGQPKFVFASLVSHICIRGLLHYIQG